MGLQNSKTHSLFLRAKEIIPHGVNSNFRHWGDEDTLVIDRGEGARIWDADGREYIDYRLAFGPIILGHAHPVVVDRVRKALEGGNIFAMTTAHEISLCERITRLCNVDKVRLTNTGSEATMHALRIARAHTNREKYIKFEGQYHGQADYFMYSSSFTPPSTLGSTRSPIPVPTTSGIPRGINDYIITLPYNDLERLEETIDARWHELAAVFVEPMVGNMSSMMPAPGFLEKIRELCDDYGIVMVMDEVKTGFRIANGGAQEYFGIQADLVTYAKSLGNGFPIAAIAGKNDVMMTIQPGLVAHGGTYSANVVGVTAADATLEFLEQESVLESIFRQGEKLMDGIRDILRQSAIPHCLSGLPSMFGVLLGTDEAPLDYRAYKETVDGELYSRLFQELVHRGVMPDPAVEEPWYLCHEHGDEEIEYTLTAFQEAVEAATAGQ